MSVRRHLTWSGYYTFQIAPVTEYRLMPKVKEIGLSNDFLCYLTRTGSRSSKFIVQIKNLKYLFRIF